MKPFTAVALAVAVIAAFAFGALTFGQTDSQATASGQEVRQLRAIAKELRTLNATIGPKHTDVYGETQTVTSQLYDIKRNTCETADPGSLRC